jgi:hypothetical protein
MKMLYFSRNAATFFAPGKCTGDFLYTFLKVLNQSVFIFPLHFQQTKERKEIVSVACLLQI